MGDRNDVRDLPHAQAIGYGSHRMGIKPEAEREYTEKATVGWDNVYGRRKYCELPTPSYGGKGAWTGARRAPYPPIFRPYTSNTRRHIVGNRKFTGMTHLGYHADIVESKPVPPLIPEGSRLATEGCPEVLKHVPNLKDGKHHYLLEASRG